MKPLPILLALCLTACGDERPPSPTAEETEQLDEVEELLNQEAKDKGPAPNGTGPSNITD